MKIFFGSLLTMGVVLSLSLPVFADDPYFTQNGVGAGGLWDVGGSGATTGKDPISGLTTLEYKLTSSFDSMVTGDLLITLTNGGPVTDLIRFETVAGVGPVAFIFSNQLTNGLPDDVGLPSYNSSDPTTLISNVYDPTSTQAGYVVGTTSNSPSGALWEYELAPAPAPVPEPGTMMLLGAGMLGLAIYGKRRMNNKA